MLDRQSIKAMFAACLILIPAAAIAGANMSKDVQTFKENAEACEHFAGEWDPDLPDENKREIQAGIDDACGKAKALYPALAKKWGQDKDVKKLLQQYSFVRQ
ncbi:hypothetical protein ACPRNU_14460 [Chromobacterium vaccinii]|uniref:hypothetical protein n=1 Tax=Chromobacterium vaccinii TaxID=1108595 RepID=UPI003C741AC6